MWSKLKWWLFGILAVLVVAYIAVTIMANVATKQQVASAEPPTLSQAKYEIILNSTRNMIYTDSYELKGSVYLIHSYWELANGKWTIRKIDLPLDQNVVGKISVIPR